MELYEILDHLNIQYDKMEHQAVYTIEQAGRIRGKLEGTGCKNLFLKNKTGAFFLLILSDYKRADLKSLSAALNTGRLTFAGEEELEKILGLHPGSVTPFGIINDGENRVTLLIDRDLKEKLLLFHPNVNTATISVSYQDLERFIRYENHRYLLVEMVC